MACPNHPRHAVEIPKGARLLGKQTMNIISHWRTYLIKHLKDFLRQIVTASNYQEYWYSGMNPAILKAQSDQWLGTLAEKQ